MLLLNTNWQRDDGAQDVSGGAPVAVEGTELPLWGMEIDVERAKAELRELGQAGAGGSSKVDDFMSGVGLGALQEQLKDLRLSAHRHAAPVCPGQHQLVLIVGVTMNVLGQLRRQCGCFSYVHSRQLQVSGPLFMIRPRRYTSASP